MREYYNRTHHEREFHPGDEVLIHFPASVIARPGLSTKLLPSWEGPFKIVERVNKVTYRIATPSKLQSVHISRIKKYTPWTIGGHPVDYAGFDRED